MSISVNKKISDFTDAMVDQMNRMKIVETGQLEGNFSTLKSVTRFIDVDLHWEVWSGAINDNFVFDSEKHGKIHNTNSRIGVGNLAQGVLGSTLLESGGGF